MRWQTSRISGSHVSSWLKRFLFFFLLLCFLVTFTPGFADELSDPNNPVGEHPWDDVCGNDQDQSSVDPPESYDLFMIPVGFGIKVIVHMQPTTPKEELGRRKVSEPKEKNRGHLLIFIR